MRFILPKDKLRKIQQAKKNHKKNHKWYLKNKEHKMEYNRQYRIRKQLI